MMSFPSVKLFLLLVFNSQVAAVSAAAAKPKEKVDTPPQTFDKTARLKFSDLRVVPVSPNDNFFAVKSTAIIQESDRTNGSTDLQVVVGPNRQRLKLEVQNQVAVIEYFNGQFYVCTLMSGEHSAIDSWIKTQVLIRGEDLKHFDDHVSELELRIIETEKDGDPEDVLKLIHLYEWMRNNPKVLKTKDLSQSSSSPEDVKPQNTRNENSDFRSPSTKPKLSSSQLLSLAFSKNPSGGSAKKSSPQNDEKPNPKKSSPKNPNRRNSKEVRVNGRKYSKQNPTGDVSFKKSVRKNKFSVESLHTIFLQKLVSRGVENLLKGPRHHWFALENSVKKNIASPEAVELLADLYGFLFFESENDTIRPLVGLSRMNKHVQWKRMFTDMQLIYAYHMALKKAGRPETDLVVTTGIFDI